LKLCLRHVYKPFASSLRGGVLIKLVDMVQNEIKAHDAVGVKMADTPTTMLNASRSFWMRKAA